VFGQNLQNIFAAGQRMFVLFAFTFQEWIERANIILIICH